MKRFIEGEDRSQITLFPERLEDYVAEDNPVRVVDAFVDQLDLYGLGFRRVDASVTGRPGYHPSVLLKLHNLWLPQPGSIEPPFGTGGGTQC